MKVDFALIRRYLLNFGFDVEIIQEIATIEIIIYGKQDRRSKFVSEGIDKMRKYEWELVSLVNLGSTWRAIFEPIKESD